MDNTEAVEKMERLILGLAGKTWSWESIAKDILAAFQADPLAYVKPKPMRWIERQVSKGVLLQAHTGLGVYKIQGVTGFYVTFNDNIASDVEPTLEAAQAAADTHRNEMLAKEFEL